MQVQFDDDSFSAGSETFDNGPTSGKQNTFMPLAGVSAGSVAFVPLVGVPAGGLAFPGPTEEFRIDASGLTVGGAVDSIEEPLGSQ
jgi:hypothetical protein